MSGVLMDFADKPEAPARHAAVVTPNDGADLPGGPCRFLYVTGGGTLNVIAMEDQAAVSLGTVSAEALIPLRCRRVMATGTTATVVALF